MQLLLQSVVNLRVHRYLRCLHRGGRYLHHGFRGRVLEHHVRQAVMELRLLWIVRFRAERMIVRLQMGVVSVLKLRIMREEIARLRFEDFVRWRRACLGLLEDRQSGMRLVQCVPGGHIERASVLFEIQHPEPLALELGHGRGRANDSEAVVDQPD